MTEIILILLCALFMVLVYLIVEGLNIFISEIVYYIKSKKEANKNE